jgi:hypothetical protein
VLYVLPGLFVAEEGRYVDENGVAEVLEFVGMDFQIVGIGRRAVEADGLQALGNAALEARPLASLSRSPMSDSFPRR